MNKFYAIKNHVGRYYIEEINAFTSDLSIATFFYEANDCLDVINEHDFADCEVVAVVISEVR